MTPPQVPDLPAEWPPTAEQLAVLTTTLHWLLADIAYELPRGEADRERLDATADSLDHLAGLFRKHQPREVIRGEVNAMSHLPTTCGGCGEPVNKCICPPKK